MPVQPLLRVGTESAPYLLRGVMEANVAQMRRAAAHGAYWSPQDAIKAGRLRYSPDDPEEHWQFYAELGSKIAKKGVALADCEDLAALVAAELRYLAEIGHPGGDPEARPVIYRVKPGLVHVIVWSPRFGYLDPSVNAGMGGDGQ